MNGPDRRFEAGRDSRSEGSHGVGPRTAGPPPADPVRRWLQGEWLRYLDPADGSASIACYRRLARSYDANTTRIEAIRETAVSALGLHPGDRVIDVGCGTGKALPMLADMVGPAGRVVGVEQSPDMARMARLRVRHLEQVSVVVAPVERFESDQRFDAALLSFTQDVLQNPVAVRRVMLACRPGARLAVVGMQFVPWWWGAALNLFNAYRARHYMTTFRGLREPWRPLRAYSPDIAVVRRWFCGSCYLALGRYAVCAVPDP